MRCTTREPATRWGQKADGGTGQRLCDHGGRREPQKASPVNQWSGQPQAHNSEFAMKTHGLGHSLDL